MADEFVRTLLHQWNLADLIPVFANQCIDEEALFLLDEENIGLIIKKIGLKIKFLHRFKILKKTRQSYQVLGIGEECSGSSFPAEPVYEFQNDCGSKCENLSEQSNEQETANSPPQTDYEHNNIHMMRLPEIKTEPVQSTFEPHSFEPLTKSDSDPPYDEYIPKAKCRRPEPIVFPQGLTYVLQNEIEGKMILARKNTLDNALRQKLSKIVVDHLLKINGEESVTEYQFIIAAMEIGRLFPSEKPEVYFRPYRRATKFNPKILSCGKLRSRYVNVKQALKKSKRFNFDDPNSNDNDSMHSFTSHTSPSVPSVTDSNKVEPTL